MLARLVHILLAALLSLPADAQSPTPDAQSLTPDAQSPTPEAPRAIPTERQASRVAVLPLTGPIDTVTLWSIERRLKAVRELGFDALVIELDTPGGEVEATLDICARLRNDAPANSVAWVRRKAYSGGTFIALACRELIVAPGAAFGDAAPITMMPGIGLTPLPVAERAKLESPLLDELDASAARRGDDPRLLQAFVSVERELWVLERASDGARRFADRAELALLGLDAAAAVATIKPPADLDSLAPSRPIAGAQLPLTEADRGAWRVAEAVDTDTRLLVVQPDEAMRWGLASAVVRDDAALTAFFGAREIVRLPESWTESLVRFLISWPIRVVLIGILVVAMVIEGLSPGVGVAGAVALAALLLLVGAPALLGLAEWWEILLVLAGIGLVAVEVFVLPGLGIAGIAGAICILVGLVASFTGTDPTSASERGALLTASVSTIAGLVLGAIMTWFTSRWFRETSVFRRAVLATSATGNIEPPLKEVARLPSAGAVGRADTDLRPSGRAEFSGELFDAQSTGEYIPRGSAVRVVSRLGSSLIVERADQDDRPAGTEGSRA
jgi:membrane-bound serine protease (ClpP class)